MKPKAWLIANGHLAPEKANQRGRMSREHVDLIKAAVANGAQIDGYSVVNESPKPVPTGPVVEKVSTDANKVYDIPSERRPEASWEAYANHNGQLVNIGMRKVCNNCSNSLNYCPCKSSVVFVDSETQVVVNYRPRSKPLANRMW